ncbi:MAG: aspartate aminotransferase family protein [bacterium]|nr:aspartate aminotransferase family protein [bacterium]
MKQIPLPEKGRSREDIIKQLKEMKANDNDWKTGRMFSLIYCAGDEIEDLAKEAYTEYMIRNALSPFSFPSLLKMETELLSMIATLFRGEEAVGSMTSGGSESILMAVKTAREWARAEKPEITEPELVMPVTAHPAFNKAAYYLGIKTRIIPVDENFRADVTLMEEAVNENTILMIGSAFTYPHGMMDSIEELSSIALENNIWFHTDSCLGGFILPFLKKAGYPVPAYDFSLPGVKSISADIHKYGYTPKGASTIMYRNKELREHQFFAYADWPGGVYGTPCVSGARPGGAIASAWAVMNYLGEEGFVKLTETTKKTAEKLMEGINAIPELYVLGNPGATVFSFAADDINIYDLQDALKKKNWHLESQHLPPCLHITVSPVHSTIVEEFLADCREACKEAARVSEEDRSEEAVIYGVMGTLPNREQAKDLAIKYLNDLYLLK